MIVFIKGRSYYRRAFSNTNRPCDYCFKRPTVLYGYFYIINHVTQYVLDATISDTWLFCNRQCFSNFERNNV